VIISLTAFLCSKGIHWWWRKQG